MKFGLEMIAEIVGLLHVQVWIYHEMELYIARVPGLARFQPVVAVKLSAVALDHFPDDFLFLVREAHIDEVGERGPEDFHAYECYLHGDGEGDERVEPLQVCDADEKKAEDNTERSIDIS